MESTSESRNIVGILTRVTVGWAAMANHKVERTGYFSISKHKFAEGGP